MIAKTDVLLREAGIDRVFNDIHYLIKNKEWEGSVPVWALDLCAVHGVEYNMFLIETEALVWLASVLRTILVDLLDSSVVDDTETHQNNLEEARLLLRGLRRDDSLTSAGD